MPARLPDHAWSLTHAGLALVTRRDGSIVPEDASGLYHRDRRIVRRLRFLIDGRAAGEPAGSRTGPWHDCLVHGVWGDGPDPDALVRRGRDLTRGYEETVTVTTFDRSVSLELAIELEAGQAAVLRLGDEIEAAPATLLTELLETDGFARDDLRLTATIDLPPHAEATLGWRLAIAIDEPDRAETAHVSASDPALDRALRHATWDLEALTLTDPKTQRPVTAAGAPHLLAAFGRDALLASLLAMSTGTERALETLDVLAAHQGLADDPDGQEEPGRILHHLRMGDVDVLGREPGAPYFGAIDTTPLFVVVMAECLAWGASHARLRPLLPAARAAVDWCRRHVDRAGFVHSVPDDSGFGHQGWKNSAGAVVGPDGSVIDGPTSPVEVQGYVHQALLGLADLEEVLGDPTLAVDLRLEADDVARRFHETFATGGATRYGPYLDREGRVVNVRASNVGHLLATGLLSDTDARRIADRLLGPDEFSGWGIRTLAAGEPAHNPLGYHTGTVWPHDTALTMRGCTLRGFTTHARRLADGLVDLATAFDGRLPELVGGFGRTALDDPVPYPASARPQAWAAAVPFQVVTSLLGLRPAMHRQEIRFAPILRPGEQLRIEGLRLGGRLLDITADGSDVQVDGDTRGITIVTPR